VDLAVTRYEKLHEAQRLTRQLIKLTAQKIITLTEMDEGIDRILGGPWQELKKHDTTIDAMLVTLKDGLKEADDAGIKN
jgi:hypothetical protein